ncbi:hypothetical protein AVEN_107869-1 [Araneus ventricosus]|uniref:Uncharacterized protein n=1 Tax=Araneus ventricosus TaxID=182803 RepID=A0A4Y2R7Q2_ARAVE|nr:hypothetical protein AVEN_107869-1 [Araneus ventricosus]
MTSRNIHAEFEKANKAFILPLPGETNVKAPSSEVTYIHSILKHAVFISGRRLIEKLTRNTHIGTQKYAKWKLSQTFQVFGVCAQRGVTSGGKTALNRIDRECDLIPVDVQYHKNCNVRFSIVGSIIPGEPSESVVGRPVDESKLEAFNKLCNFLDNKYDCQCLLSDLMEMFLPFRTVSDKLYSEKRLRKLLSEIYGNTVLILSSIKCFGTVLSFRSVASKILTDN